MLRAENFARRILQRIRAAIAIRVWNPIYLGRKRLEAGLIWMRLAGHRHRHVGSAVKRVFKGNDRGAARVGARDLHRIFGGFGARVHEQCFLWAFDWDDRIQPLANGDVALIRQHVEAGVEKAIKLTANCVDDGGSAVPGIEAANASRKIDQTVAVYVFDDRAFRLRNKDRRGMECALHDRGIAPLHQRLRTWSGNRGAELNCRHDSSQFSEFDQYCFCPSCLC